MTSHSDSSQLTRFDWWGAFKKMMFWSVAPVIIFFAAFVFYRGTFFTFVENYQLGYKYDWRTGKSERLDRPGYHFALPFLQSVNSVDLRPMQVCINANNRVLNCKLVQFNPDGLETFISWHGRADYDGSATRTGTFNDILKSYAYDGLGKTYPFLIILRELKTEELATPQ